MSGRGSGNGRRRQTGIRIEENGGKTHFIGRSVVESMKEATGATEDDINVLLKECNGDVDEATSKLIDSPFTMVTSRKQKRRQRQEEESKARKPGPSQAGTSGSNGHGHSGKGGFQPRSNGTGGHQGKAKPRDGQRSAGGGNNKGSRTTDRAPAAGHSGAGRKTPNKLPNGEYSDWGHPDEEKPHPASNGAWGVPTPPVVAPTTQDRGFPNLEQEAKAPGGQSATTEAPKRTSMADIVRGTPAPPPSAPVAAPMVGITPPVTGAVPVKTGYAAAAARALAPPATSQATESRARAEQPSAGPSTAAPAANPGPSESTPPTTADVKSRSLAEKAPPGFAMPHALEASTAQDSVTVTGDAPGVACAPSSGAARCAPQPEATTSSQVINDWDRPIAGLETRAKDEGPCLTDAGQAAPAPGTSARFPDPLPKQELAGVEYTEPLGPLVRGVAPVVEQDEEFGETLKFGSFAGIEEFGGGIAIPGEPAGLDAVVSLDAVQETVEDLGDGRFDAAMQSVVERTLVQPPAPVDLQGDAGPELAVPPALEARDREEEMAPPLATGPAMHEQEQTLEAEPVPPPVDIDHGIVQEAAGEMGSYAQPSPLEKIVDTKADAATQVVEEPDAPGAKVGATYTSTGVQHGSYAMPTPAVSVTPPSQDYKVDKPYTEYGEAEISDGSVQTNQAHAGYRVPVQDFKPETFEPRTAPMPTVPGYGQLAHAQVQAHGGHPAKHEPHAPPPPPPPMMSGPPGPPPRYGGPSSASAQAETTGNVPSSIPHPPPASGAPGMPMVRPPANPHMPQYPLASPAMMPNPAAMPYNPHYYPQYFPAQFHAGMFGGGYPYAAGGFTHGTESAAYPAGHMPPGGWPPKNVGQSYTPSVGGSGVNPGYQGNYGGTGVYATHLGNPAYEMNNSSGGYGGAKDKETYIQPGVQHGGYQGVSNSQLPRNDMAYYHQVPGQGYSQGFRNQHQYNFQYGGGAGYGAHPHNFPSVGVQGGNYGRHGLQ